MGVNVTGRPVDQAVGTQPTAAPIDTTRLTAVLVGNGLKRIAASAGGVLIGFYLAYLASLGEMIDAALVGALAVTYNLVELSGAIPMGVLTDRFTPRALMVSGTILGAAATQLFGISGAVAIFFLARALEGLAAAAATPATLTHLTDVTQSHSAARGRVFGFFELTLLAGLALGGLVGGAMWDTVQTGAFSLVAFIYLTAAVLFYWGASPKGLSAEATTHHAITREQARQILANRHLRRLAPAWLAINAILGLWLTHAAFQMTGPAAEGQSLVGEFTATEVGGFFLIYAIVFGIGIVGWGFALARISRVWVMRLGMVTIPLAALWLYLLNTLPDLPTWARTTLILLTGLTILIESGFTPAALAYLADLAGRTQGPGTVMGLYSMLFGLGNLLGAALGGILARSMAINGLLLGTTILALIGLIALAFLGEET